MAVKTVLGVLKRGRKRIQHKWTRNTFYRNGAYCALGSIGFGAHDKDTPNRLRERAKAMLSDILSSEGHFIGVASYNDKSRTKKRILDLFDKAIRKAQYDSIT